VSHAMRLSVGFRDQFFPRRS